MFGGLRLWGNVSNRFFNDRLGAVLNLNYETRNEGSDRIQVNYNMQDAGAIGEAVYMLGELRVYDQIKTSRNIGGSFVLDYDLDHLKDECKTCGKRVRAEEQGIEKEEEIKERDDDPLFDLRDNVVLALFVIFSLIAVKNTFGSASPKP